MKFVTKEVQQKSMIREGVPYSVGSGDANSVPQYFRGSLQIPEISAVISLCPRKQPK